MLIPTGSAEYAKVKNIYDINGNVSEWTMTADTDQYRTLKGNNGLNNSVNQEYVTPTQTMSEFGSRATLYIK